VTSPRPAVRHAAAASSLHSGLYGRFDRRGGGAPGGWVLLFEPQPETLEVYRLEDRGDGAGWRLLLSVAGSQMVRAAPFDAVEFDLAKVWAR